MREILFFSLAPLERRRDSIRQKAIVPTRVPRAARRPSRAPFPVDRLVLVRDSSRSTLGRASDAIIIARRSSRVALFRFALRHPPRKRLDFPLERRDRRDQRLAFRSQSHRLLLTRR